MRDNLDIGDVDVGVGVNEVLTENGGVELRGGDRVLLCSDVDCVFDGVCCDDDGVVCFCVGLLDVTLEEAADGHFGDCLDFGGWVAVNGEDADIVFAIAGC